jgi:hydroxyacyl-ACP dehydratase HTD2-like protein with hotdog domain
VLCCHGELLPEIRERIVFMTDASEDYAAWIGRQEVTDDDLCLAPALAAAAMFDDTSTTFAMGSPLPPVWHWFYFLPRAPQALLGVDGHPSVVASCRRSPIRDGCLPAHACVSTVRS